MRKQLKTIKWAIIGFLILTSLVLLASVIGGFTGRSTMYGTIFMLIGGLILGGSLVGLAMWKFRGNSDKGQIIRKESSQTVLESVKKVFKIVLVEGQFSEIYNFEETEKVLGILPSTKKALVMNTSNVLIGFDINKCVWEVDEINQTLRILKFPEAEILSMDTDIKYYNMENGLFNRFDKEDYETIQKNIKTQITNAVYKSDLPQLANQQIKVMLEEVLEGRDWLLASQSPNLQLN